jgi:hypothetical protein
MALLADEYRVGRATVYRVLDRARPPRHDYVRSAQYRRGGACGINPGGSLVRFRDNRKWQSRAESVAEDPRRTLNATV